MSQNRPAQGGTERPEKCLETGKWQNPLLKQNRHEQGGTERPGKCPETGKWQNPLLKQNRHEQGGTERMESVQKQENDKILC